MDPMLQTHSKLLVASKHLILWLPLFVHVQGAQSALLTAPLQEAFPRGSYNASFILLRYLSVCVSPTCLSEAGREIGRAHV